MFKIFITADVAKEAKEFLEKEFVVDIHPNMEEDELCKVIGEYDAVITRSQTKITKKVIHAATNLKVIGRAGVGIDGIDIPEATAKGITVVNTPESNMNLASGVAPVNKFLDEGLRVGLATDVAGGSHESMLRAMTHAIQASKLRWRLYDQEVKPLPFERAFYLATMGGGAFFGNVGSFLDGYEFDAVVLDDASLDHPQELSVRARLERAAYLADDRNLTAKFVAGQKILG